MATRLRVPGRAVGEGSTRGGLVAVEDGGFDDGGTGGGEGEERGEGGAGEGGEDYEVGMGGGGEGGEVGLDFGPWDS